jgi:hypothetical protein
MASHVTEEEMKYISIESLHHNNQQIDVVRSFMCIVGGIIAGLNSSLGLSGFLFFITLYMTVSVALMFKMKFNVKMHTNMSNILYFISDLQKNGLSFILFWALTYALVYIY